MNLVFIYGTVASGKYTVARALTMATGFELYHNHLVVDEVLTRYSFGTPNFVAERDRIWRQYFHSAATSPSRRIIFTFCPESSVPQQFIDWVFNDLCDAGVLLCSVQLVLSETAVVSRLQSLDRRDFNKLTDLALYRELLANGVFRSPVIPRTDLEIDTEQHTVAQSVAQIQAFLAVQEFWM